MNYSSRMCLVRYGFEDRYYLRLYSTGTQNYFTLLWYCVMFCRSLFVLFVLFLWSMNCYCDYSYSRNGVSQILTILMICYNIYNQRRCIRAIKHLTSLHNYFPFKTKNTDLNGQCLYKCLV
jgi:hypothetical protein